MVRSGQQRIMETEEALIKGSGPEDALRDAFRIQTRDHLGD